VLDTLADLPFAPAVYAIENIVNGKVYILSSLNGRRRGAIISRRYAKAATPNRYLQRAFDKPPFRIHYVRILRTGLSSPPRSE
jgi:hypothetical protein